MAEGRWKVNLFVSPPPLPPQMKRSSILKIPPPFRIRQQPRRHKREKQPLALQLKGREKNVIVRLGESGVSYLFPGAPFEFMFSYSETPNTKPLSIREPTLVPFAPHLPPRPWTGNSRRKPVHTNLRLIRSSDARGDTVYEVQGPLPFATHGTPRTGDKSLTNQETRQLLRPLLSSNRQINLGRDGVTHNMLEMVHQHWKRSKVCKVRCRGVPTVDMANICHHLQDKTGGCVIHQSGGVLFLYRGRNYIYCNHSQYPLMLWKPLAPFYPKLIEDNPGGLTEADAAALRRKGQKMPASFKLAKNGIYINLVKEIREAFEVVSMVKINCEDMPVCDCKRLGSKLKDLVPCVLLSFEEQQMLIWRGKSWTSMYSDVLFSCYPSSSGRLSSLDVFAAALSHSMLTSLWKNALETKKAQLIDDMKEKNNNLEAYL